jgi:hypothetical protein
MPKIGKYTKISSGGKNYAIFDLDYKDNDVPIILDLVDFKYIKKLDKSWNINDAGFVVCHHTHDDAVHELCIHEIVMALKNKEGDMQGETRPILHINKLGIDNRRENLMYDVPNKKTKKNMKKKKRIIDLPDECGISPDELPTYVWYLKPDETHGERFIVEVGNKSWKTTSSKKYDLRHKLEQAKEYLRDLKKTDPKLFEEYSMNGELNKEGKELLDSFYKIIYKGGFNNIRKIINDNLTDKYLQPFLD